MEAKSKIGLPGVNNAELRHLFNGNVILPGDEGYEKVRTPIFSGIDRHPAAFFLPKDAAQVAQVIHLAHQTRLNLAVRSGGHSLAVHSLVDGGIVLDLKGMCSLEIDTSGRTAWAQTGLTTGQYTTEAAKFGLATGFGDTATVGIGGLTLGGGIGYLSRKYGLTIDQLLAAEVVTASGEILLTDLDNHPDLFWALRGGGGNFGVATRFKYQLHPVNKVYGGMLVLPATPEVVTGLVEEALSASEDLSMIANIMKAPPMPFLPPEAHGKLIVMLMLLYAGPVENGEKAVRGFRNLSQPLADMVRPLTYPEMFPPEEGDFRPILAAHTCYTSNIDRECAKLILDHLQRSTAMIPACQVRVLGGAISRIPHGATAYAHRRQNILINFAAIHMNPAETPSHQDWADTTAAFFPMAGAAQYVNFLGNVPESSIRAAYPGEVWERLSKVKAVYDPENFFHQNQNIPPARVYS